MSSKCSPRAVLGPWRTGVHVEAETRNVAMKANSFNRASLRFVEETQEEEIGVHQSYVLPYFDVKMFASILEDAITEIRVLVECNNGLLVCKAYSDMPMLLARKFGIRQPEYDDELDHIDKENIDSNGNKFRKLDADRKFFEDVCLDAFKDLTLNDSYQELVRHVEALVDLNIYRVNLAETEARNRQSRRDLSRQLRQQRNHIKSVTYDTEATIEDLKSQIGDCSLIDNIESRYVEGWQRARTEQHILTIHRAESGPYSSIDYYKQRTEHEQRVHSEIEVFTNILTNEMLEKIEFWMAKYDADIEAMDLRIQLKRNEYQDMRNRRRDFEATMEKHDMMIKEWNSFKEARAKARAYWDLMTKSAIIVQAWWRGLLVRRQLGPYKPKTKKQPPKKRY